MKKILLFLCMAAPLLRCAPAAAADAKETTTLSAPARELLSARLCGNAAAADAAAGELASGSGDVAAGFLLAIHWGDAAMRARDGERRREAEAQRDYYRSLADDRVRALARRGDPLAVYLLTLGQTNEARRVRPLRTAAAGDVPWALADLGTILLDEQLRRERRSEQRLRECHNLFAAAARQGEPTGLFQLGFCRFLGLGCQADDKAAFQLLQRAVEPPCEHPQAFALLGECYRDGRGTEKDELSAMRCFQKSASLGCPAGIYAYACALRDGCGVATNDVHAAREQFLRAAELGLPEAMVAAGDLFAAEDGDAAKTAFLWYCRAAHLTKHPLAMDRVGECLLHGRGVESDPAAAVRWFYRAAWRHDCVPAMRHLAECCDLGIGGLERSHDHANWWRTRAMAVQGDRNACVWLGAHEPDLFAPDRLGAPWNVQEEP